MATGVRHYICSLLIVASPLILILLVAPSIAQASEWSDPVCLTPHLGGVVSFDVAQGDDGNFHVVYGAEDNFTDVYYLSLSSDGTQLVGPVIISNGGYLFPPSISFGPLGYVHVLCGSQEDLSIQYLRIDPSDGNVMKRIPISEDVSSVGTSAIDVTDNGDVFIVWAERQSELRLTSIRHDGSLNVSRKKLTMDAQLPRFPSISVSPNQSLHIVWMRGTLGTLGEVYYQAYDHSGTPRDSAFNISTIDYTESSNPDISRVDANGLIVAWNDYVEGLPREPKLSTGWMKRISFDRPMSEEISLSPENMMIGIPRISEGSTDGVYASWNEKGEEDVIIGKYRRIQEGYSDTNITFFDESDDPNIPLPVASIVLELRNGNHLVFYIGEGGTVEVYSSRLYYRYLTVTFPDLCFSEPLNVSNERPSTNQPVQLGAVIKNVGVVKASNARLVIRARDRDGFENLIAIESIPTLLPGQSHFMRYQWVARTGNHILVYTIKGCEPAEFVTWNNTAEIAFINVSAIPIIQIDDPPSMTVLGGVVNVSGRAWDLDWDPLSFQYRIDNGRWVPFDGGPEWSFSFVTNVLTDERHSIGVRCWDGQDHSNVDVLDFFVNNAVDDPDQTFLIVDTWPSDTITINTITEIEFGVTTWTYFNRVITYEWSMNETEVAADASTFTLNSSYYTNGSYTLTVSCSDGEQELEHEWDLTIEVPPADTIPPDDPVNENEPPNPFWALIALVVIFVIGSLSFYIWKRNST